MFKVGLNAINFSNCNKTSVEPFTCERLPFKNIVKYISIFFYEKSSIFRIRSRLNVLAGFKSHRTVVASRDFAFDRQGNSIVSAHGSTELLGLLRGSLTAKIHSSAREILEESAARCTPPETRERIHNNSSLVCY